MVPPVRGSVHRPSKPYSKARRPTSAPCWSCTAAWRDFARSQLVGAAGVAHVVGHVGEQRAPVEPGLGVAVAPVPQLHGAGAGYGEDVDRVRDADRPDESGRAVDAPVDPCLAAGATGLLVGPPRF